MNFSSYNSVRVSGMPEMFTNRWRLMFQETARTQRRTSCPQRKLLSLKVRNDFLSFRINSCIYLFIFTSVPRLTPHQAIELVDGLIIVLKNPNTEIYYK